MYGWIKLYRQMTDWQWYQNNNVKSVFIHLLLKANHAENLWQGYIIKRGQVMTSVGHMAEELGYAREVKEYKKEPEKWPGHVGDISTVLRVAITRRRNTPDLYEIMHVLGKANVEKRIELITK